MIFVTGDCHADFEKFATTVFPEQAEMTKDDIVIILVISVAFGIKMEKATVSVTG